VTLALQAQSKSLVRRFHFCQHPLPSSSAPDSGETKQDSCVTAVSLLRTQELPGYWCAMNSMSCQRMELGPAVCPLVLNCMAWGTMCHANALSCHEHVTGGTALSFQGRFGKITKLYTSSNIKAWHGPYWGTERCTQISSPVGHPLIRTRIIRNYLLTWAKLLFTPIHWQNCTSPVILSLGVGIPEGKAAKAQRKMDGKHDQLRNSIFSSILEVSTDTREHTRQKLSNSERGAWQEGYCWAADIKKQANFHVPLPFRPQGTSRN